MPPKKKQKVEKSRTIPKSIILSTGKCIYNDGVSGGRHYFDFVTIQPPNSYSEPLLQWNIFVGDIVAVACEQSKGQKQPFGVSWSPVQIISLYQTPNNKRMRMTMKWFFRHSELSKSMGSLLNNIQDPQEQRRTVYETNELQSYDVENILGKVDLYSSAGGPHRHKPYSLEQQLPTVSLRCDTYIQTDIQNNNDAAQPVDWDSHDLFNGAMPSSLSRGGKWDSDELLTAMGSEFACGDRLTFKNKSTVAKLKASSRPHPQTKSNEKPATNKRLPKKHKSSSHDMQVDDDDSDAAIIINTLFMQAGDEDDDSSSSCDESNKRPLQKQYDTMPKVEPNALLHSATFGKGVRRYYSSLKVPIQARRCAPRVVKPNTRGERWTVDIGDIICLQTNNAKPQAAHIFERNQQNQKSKAAQRWYPFTVPWSYAQVLNVYESERKQGTIFLEIRWFCRLSETSVDPDAIPFQMDASSGMEEIFETHHVQDAVSADGVLGRADVSFGHHSVTGRSKIDGPTVPARCRYLLFMEGSMNRFQPIFCADTTPKEWFRYMKERGMEVSKLCKKDALLASGLSWLLEPEVNLFSKMSPVKGDEEGNIDLCVQDDTHCFSAVSVTPPWANFCNPSIICHPRDRRDILGWRISVGDIVACHVDGSSKLRFYPGRQEWHPYIVPWAACQIMAISRHTKHDNELMFEVRWFYRAVELTDVPKEDLDTSDRLQLDLLYEVDDSPTSVVGESSLLGPLTLLSLNRECSRVARPSPFLPLNVLLYGGTYSSSGRIFESVRWSLIECLQRGMQYTESYGSDELSRNNIWIKLRPLLPREEEQWDPSPQLEGSKTDKSCQEKKLIGSTSNIDKSSAVSLPSELSLDEKRVWIDVKPYHEDLSAKRSYYTQLNVKLPYGNYVAENANVDLEGLWTVKMGDPAIVHWSEMSGGTLHPFTVKWAVCEVTSIWIQHDKVNELPCNHKGLIAPLDGRRGVIMVEIRWFYRDYELPGAAKVYNKAVSTTYEEVFETDHMDTLEATSLLAPALLNPSFEQEQEAKNRDDGVPVLSFECRRMWSIHRKSLVPIGPMERRVDRGRKNSDLLGKNKLLHRDLESFLSGSSSSTEAVATPRSNDDLWKGQFENAIKKLALIEASEDAHDRGIDLIGRETEQQTISSFLRNAIKGCDMEFASADATTSMLVAGPPGTGKTATVCSIIAKLRKEQADGLLPTFEFISLNGMEMRNPYEAYIKFWEAVSGNRDKKGYEVAVGLLDRFFAGKLQTVDDGTSDSNKSSKPVIVLMLDEIDYLVTAKQTVVYNFFDWPMRASMSQNGGPRLVVIGISNRLNLASLLKPSVQSRLGHFRCSFKSYNAQGLVEILTNKIQPDPTGYRVFDKDAILFCARKIAAHSGDLRKALKTCQAAAMAVMKEVQDGVRNDPKSTKDQPTVRIQDVQKVTQEAFHSIATQAISASRVFPALLLICLGALCKSTGQENGGFDVKQLMTKMNAVASASGNKMYMPPPSFHATLKILSILAQDHLIRLETPKSSATLFRAAQGGSGGAFPLIFADFDHSILVRAFKDTVHKELAEKHLGGVH